ncbi:permease prefix domain 1-containing protein [bacterium]|nr:permease prefix domain 1-containing protein [bacterium]
MKAEQSMEDRILQWREHLNRHQSIQSVDADELEDHLRSQIESLEEQGLDEDEAFLVSVKRMGNLSDISREFALEYSERLWKQLLIPPVRDEQSEEKQSDTFVAFGLALAAAATVKLPQLFGFSFDGSPDSESFYMRNIILLILPFLAAFFVWKRRLEPSEIIKVTAPFVAAALLINLLPFTRLGSTELLAVIHLPIAVWFVLGLAYMGGKWNNHSQRMNFVRFSGEWFIYLTLIAFGGGVLTMFTVFIFDSIGMDAELFVQSWLLPCGVAGAVVVSGWLVEAKQSIIENMAPVLTRLFTPLFALLLLSYIIAMLWTGTGILVEREVLIGFDLLLVVILGLLLYSISARDPHAAPDLFDRLQFLLIVSALLVDIFALWAIAARISEFGFSPNKVAALGENLILLINLAGSAFLYGKFLLKRTTFSTLERWQMTYFPVYPIWAAIVVIIFPIIFKFQ